MKQEAKERFVDNPKRGCLRLMRPWEECAAWPAQDQARLKGAALMSTTLVHIGFGNRVSLRRIVAVVDPDSGPIKRLVREARDNHTLIDATYGRRTRSVVIMDSGHVVLASIQPETLANRAAGEADGSEDDGVER